MFTRAYIDSYCWCISNRFHFGQRFFHFRIWLALYLYIFAVAKVHGASHTRRNIYFTGPKNNMGRNWADCGFEGRYWLVRPMIACDQNTNGRIEWFCRFCFTNTNSKVPQHFIFNSKYDPVVYFQNHKHPVPSNLSIRIVLPLRPWCCNNYLFGLVRNFAT